MAHVAKYQRKALGPMVGHYAREAERDGYTRSNIDPERTHLNYAIGAEDVDALALTVKGRVAQAVEDHAKAAGRAVRTDAVLLVDWVVTLPKDCPRELAPKFFDTVVSYIRNRYGEDNVPGGFVHMDEATPHVHVPVVPTLDGKLQASKLVNRRDLQTWHTGLQRVVDEALGMHVSVELGAEQKGEKQLSALSQDEYKAAKDELARLQGQCKAVYTDLASLRDKRDEIARETSDASERLESLHQRESDVEREVEELRRAVEERQGAVDAARLVASGIGGREIGKRAEQARERIAELGSRIDGLRERCRSAQKAVAGLIERASAAVKNGTARLDGRRLDHRASIRFGRTLADHGLSFLVEHSALLKVCPEIAAKQTDMASRIRKAREAARTPSEERQGVRSVPRPYRPHRGR